MTEKNLNFYHNLSNVGFISLVFICIIILINTKVMAPNNKNTPFSTPRANGLPGGGPQL